MARYSRTLNLALTLIPNRNAYWLAQQTDSDIDLAFKDMAALGLTVVRTWAFNEVTSAQDYGAYYTLWTDGVQTFNTGTYGAFLKLLNLSLWLTGRDTGFPRLDYVIAAAEKVGIKVVLVLTNNWSDYGGMETYISQLDSGG